MISIIIPAYNSEKYITETINSVLTQTYTDWELIIIDDGSTDNTAEIVKQFCEKDDRIKYYYQENSGVSSARNLGIEKAEGNIIAFLDADDVWLEDNLSEKNKVLSDNTDVDWVFSQIIYFSQKKEVVDNNIEDINKLNWLDSLLLWKGEVKTTPSNIIVKRKCLKSGIRFDTNLSTAADQDFCIQLAAKYRGRYIAKPLVKYRIVENSMSSNIFLMEKDHIRVYKKAEKNKLFKSFWFKQQCFSNLYWILAGSWWKDGNNKKRGLYFIIKALLANPFSVVKIFNKKK
jgi:glycosyltransferase involved in cell wall biosynthesis